MLPARKVRALIFSHRIVTLKIEDVRKHSAATSSMTLEVRRSFYRDGLDTA